MSGKGEIGRDNNGRGSKDSADSRRSPMSTPVTTVSNIVTRSIFTDSNSGGTKPKSSKCPKCNLGAVKHKGHMLLCTECKQWYHHLCLNISKTEYDLYQKKIKTGWKCLN